MNEFLIAQIVFVIACILNVIAIQFKRKQHILLMFIITTFMFAVGFHLLGALPGTLSCLIMSAFTVIRLVCEKKGKATPLWLVIVFIGIAMLPGIFAVEGPLDYLPVAAAALYILSVTQKKERFIRLFTFVGLVLWVIYHVVVSAYVAAVFDGLFALSGLVAIVRYDILRLAKKDS
jgi:hypothetical protein